jgi:hypothetical protein
LYAHFNLCIHTTLETMRKPKTLLAVAALALAIGSAQAGDFGSWHTSWSTEERALQRRNEVMEMYRPTEHTGHMIGLVRVVGPNANGRRVKLLIFNFGIELAQQARSQGREMRAFNYTPAMAQQFLFAQGWDRSKDRFYTRAYVQEGMAGYNGE